MNYSIYNLLTTLAAPPAAAWIAVSPKHRPLLARFLPPIPDCSEPPIWVHACSVGELSVARPLLAALVDHNPTIPTVLTVSTTTAWAIVAKDPPRAAVTWFPVDQRHVVARFFDRLRPRALVLVETEIWPNILREAQDRDVPVLVVNARLSDKHYARYQRHAPFFRTVFSRITAVAAQHQTYADRFASLGVEPDRVTVTGNVKFDNVVSAVNAEKQRLLRAQCGLEETDPIIVFGSTRPGDEALAAACWGTWKVQFPNARLIVVPRHRSRLHEARAAFDEPVAVRSVTADGKRPTDERVLMVDTLGELVDFYALATVAIIGGSFYPGVNGHNPLESAALGVPTVFGPYMSNFRDPAQALVEARGAVRLDGPDALEGAVTALLRDSSRRGALSFAGRAAIAANKGALERTRQLVETLVLNSSRAT